MPVRKQHQRLKLTKEVLQTDLLLLLVALLLPLLITLLVAYRPARASGAELLPLCGSAATASCRGPGSSQLCWAVFPTS